MKAYGIGRMESGDNDVAGCRLYGRPTRFLAPSFAPSRPRSMRGLKNKATRRVWKKIERTKAKRQIDLDI
jgi:hypothetical protein